MIIYPALYPAFFSSGSDNLNITSLKGFGEDISLIMNFVINTF